MSDPSVFQVAAASIEPIGLRRYGRIVDLPLSTREKVRLGRAIVKALSSPQRSMATLRKTVLSLVAPLRACGWGDAEIVERLSMLVEDAALAYGLTTTSVLTGRPRWTDLCERIGEWVALRRAIGSEFDAVGSGAE